MLYAVTFHERCGFQLRWRLAFKFNEVFFLVVHAEVYGVSNLNVFLLWEILRELEKKETQNAVSFKIGLAVFLLWYL